MNLEFEMSDVVVTVLVEVGEELGQIKKSEF